MANDFLGTDMKFEDDFSIDATGESGIVSAEACLIQDTINKLRTPKGDLWYDETYGFDMFYYLHAENTPVNRLEFEQEVTSVVEDDPRVITGSTTIKVILWELNRIKYSLAFQPITETNPINLVIGYGLNGTEVELNGL